MARRTRSIVRGPSGDPVAPAVLAVAAAVGASPRRRTRALAPSRSRRHADPAPAPARPSSGRRVTFYGRGYGHGVGMSQYGARGRALAGQDAADDPRPLLPGHDARRRSDDRRDPRARPPPLEGHARPSRS